MKIAICSLENNEQSKISERFGRAPWIAVYDNDSKKWEFIENSQNLNAMQGAGIQTAQNVINTEVQAVITCNTGPKAMKVLQSAEIKVYEVSAGKRIVECVVFYEAGKLACLETANVEGHWA